MLKTYQALIDEEHEREEQEMLARREQVMLDLQAAQQDAQNAEAREANGDEMEEGEGEVDLDDEVPEAEADESDVSVSGLEGDTVSEVEEGSTRQDVTFNEDSFIEGSMLEDHVSHMLAREEASMAGTLQEERDLDDDIPEAGEYEHTDSSLIDSSDEDDTQASFAAPPPIQRRRESRREGRRSSGMAARRSSGPVLVQQSNRRSVELEGSSSIMEGSSFLRSSPAAARGSLRARFMGARGGRAC